MTNASDDLRCWAKGHSPKKKMADRTLLEVIPAAMAHTAGPHQDSVMVERPGGVVGFERRDPPYLRPKPAQTLQIIDGGKV